MNTTLAHRPYRLCMRLFTRTARSFLWWLVIGIPVTFAITIVFGDAIEIGAWTIAASVFQWFVAVSAGMVIHLILPTQIATGLTRREITTAIGMFGALLCAASVLIVAAGFLAEHAMLAALDADPAPLGETLAHAARYLLITPLYCSVGLAIGAAEIRMRPGGSFHGFVQVPAILVIAGLLGVACMWFEYSPAWSDTWSAASSVAWTGAGLAFLGVMAAAFVLLMRGMPVHPKRA
ncbi:hypothetical protein [Glycomyces arizonensis]|uniref:hypothetical protein n=1 Tax=Glycomyces arizonensis TaxID=256035 RepID=UPI0012EC0198|nr:hypothetical protein [Glycomyces arizonensis]